MFRRFSEPTFSMLSRSLPAALALLSTVAAHAQPASPRPYVRPEVGIRAGWSTSTVLWQAPPGNAWPAARREAAFGGVAARVPVDPRVSFLSFQPELLFVPRGWSRSEPTVRAEYLELPLLLRIDTSDSDAPHGLFMYAGPAPALLVRCRVAFDYREADDAVHHHAGGCGDVDPLGARSRLRRGDFGAAMGAGGRQRVGRGAWTFDVRHTRGVVDVDRHDTPTTPGRRTLTRAWTLSVAAWMPLRP
jgi:hypothetical protein